MVTLGAAALEPFPRVARYNSPYRAHRGGRAIDLYPGTAVAPSPVAGTVTMTRQAGAPSRPYAAEHDYLIVIDTGSELARILHVDPDVEAGETVEIGDPLGSLVRSGYFAPWVDNHVHLGFREYGTDPVRASGSLPVELGVPVAGVGWDGTGTIREAGETYAILDSPPHPTPGDRFVGLADDTGQYVLDGGLPHYETGGVHPVHGREGDGAASLLGTELTPGTGTVEWPDLTVRVNGQPITGLSLLLGRDRFGAKLICPDLACSVGESVTVTVS
ncbi:hypothetical protein [Halodesulfurarchaeum formicicum]|uniref:Uncharacterized protein n=1 Tax=Halodesulfurarchaeum formicicum TaxID=1873524 RepID=A0A1J1AEB8_9EURY|nr:hypothetical protein [Halodesulfurarchaeum formicicum]APE96147.1 hypothetical protein HSR6_1709 [Halodesulfurarchaeum formicicum]